MRNAPQLVQKLWNYCDILRDDGLSYDDYVEQLTYLLFLKMDEEQTHLRQTTGYGGQGQSPATPSSVPKGYDWPSLTAKDGDELETHLASQALQVCCPLH